MIEFDLSRALLLTYAGVGAAFVVLGSLIVFTVLLGWWGNRRRRRAAEAPAAADATAGPVAVAAAAPAEEREEPAPPAPQVAAAIAAAVALALEEEWRERREMERQPPEAPAADGAGWKSQGRIVAFDARRLRDRER